MKIKRILSDAEIDHVIKNAVEGFEPAAFANDVFRKYAKGSISEEEALRQIRNNLKVHELK